MSDPKKVWVWVGVAVVVVAVVWGAVYWLSGSGGPGGMQAGAGTGVPVHAQAGQVVAGFPQELILGAATGTDGSPEGITNSYSIDYSSSTNQYTAEWDSSSTPAALYAAYQSYLTNNGWTPTNEADTTALKGVYAITATSSLNVVITPQGADGAKVTLSYVNQ